MDLEAFTTFCILSESEELRQRRESAHFDARSSERFVPTDTCIGRRYDDD